MKAIELVKARQNLTTIVYVIDNHEKGGTSLETSCLNSRQYKRLNVDLTYISGHGNIGYGCGHNLVISNLRSDLHLMLNPDVMLESDALIEAINVFCNDKSVVMLSPYAEESNGQKQYLCKRDPSVLTLFLRGFLPKFSRKYFPNRLYKYEMQELPEDKITGNIQLISGCFMLSDTQALKEIKGFNKNYFLYFEDFDLSLRIATLGKIVYAPNVRITHDGGKTATKGLSHVKMFLTSAVRFFSKHGWRFF